MLLLKLSWSSGWIKSRMFLPTHMSFGYPTAWLNDLVVCCTTPLLREIAAQKRLSEPLLTGACFPAFLFELALLLFDSIFFAVSLHFQLDLLCKRLRPKYGATWQCMYSCLSVTAQPLSSVLSSLHALTVLSVRSAGSLYRARLALETVQPPWSPCSRIAVQPCRLSQLTSTLPSRRQAQPWQSLHAIALPHLSQKICFCFIFLIFSLAMKVFVRAPDFPQTTYTKYTYVTSVQLYRV